MKVCTIVTDGESGATLSGVLHWPSDTKFDHFHPESLFYKWTESDKCSHYEQVAFSKTNKYIININILSSLTRKLHW